MTPLSESFLARCPVEDGFRMRGLEMTRVEVFVDAAFAFAVTMLVISFDAIPNNYEELLHAIKSIPAFVVAVGQLVWIWYTHNKWSRRYGLDDAWTVVLSAALLVVVLVYIYPLRILMGGMFTWFTNGYLPGDFVLRSWEELAGLFVFLGIGWIVLCTIYVLMYRYAAHLHEPLRLNESELRETHTLAWLWTGAAGIGALAVAFVLLVPAAWSPFTGFTYLLLGIWFPAARWWRRPPAPEPEGGTE